VSEKLKTANFLFEISSEEAHILNHSLVSISFNPEPSSQLTFPNQCLLDFLSLTFQNSPFSGPDVEFCQISSWKLSPTCCGRGKYNNSVSPSKIHHRQSREFRAVGIAHHPIKSHVISLFCTP
jgi:hypothetical protein